MECIVHSTGCFIVLCPKFHRVYSLYCAHGTYDLFHSAAVPRSKLVHNDSVSMSLADLLGECAHVVSYQESKTLV